MKRILHIVSSLGKGSGVMNFIMNYYRVIDRNKINFDFMYFSDISNSFEKEILDMGGNVFKIDKPSFSYNFNKTVKTFFKNQLNEYDAIHCHPIFSFFFFAKQAKRFGVKNIIQHTHTTKLSEKKLSIIRNWIILRFSKFYVTKYAACSNDALRILPKKDLKRKGYIIINNAINLKKYRFNENKRNEIRKKLGIASSTKVIGHVGRFSKEKNHLLLIDIFKRYNAQNSDSILLLLGEGNLKEEILKKIKILNLTKKVIMVGVKKDVENYLFAMDYFVFPSSFEGLGIAAIEAQVSGLKTICSLAIPDCAIISPIAKKYNTDNIDEIVQILNQDCNYNRKEIFNQIKIQDFNLEIQKENMEKFYLDLK